jgi:hypothetical protein
MKTRSVVPILLITFLLVSCFSITSDSTIPKPITYTGKGNAYLTVNKWRGSALIHVEYFGKDSFNAWNLNDNESLLYFALSTKGSYSGTQILDFSDSPSSQTSFIEIYTTGNWTVEILPFEYGKRVDVPGVFTGKNNDVIFLEGETPISIEVSLPEAGRYFVIEGYGEDGYLPLFDGTSPYQERKQLEKDLKMLVIQYIGDWEISIKD